MIKQTHSQQDADKIMAILDKISIFAGLSDKQITSLLKLVEKVNYPKGEFIFNQGEKPSHIYIVLSGSVKIVANIATTPLELIQFEVGQCFGETSVIGIQPHTATAIANETTELIILSRKTLLSIFNTDKELFGILIMNIAREACRRLHHADEIMLHYVLNNGKKG